MIEEERIKVTLKNIVDRLENLEDIMEIITEDYIQHGRPLMSNYDEISSKLCRNPMKEIKERFDI